MKVRVLRSAFDDLAAGRQFYNRQRRALDNIFSTACFRILIRCCFMRESTGSSSATIACWRAVSHMQSIIESSKAKRSFFVFWIAA
jgi:hypothetical protein